jgi:hypothetical protein
VLQRCHRDATVTFRNCGFRTVFQWCYDGLTVVLRGRDNYIPELTYRLWNFSYCRNGVQAALQQCYNVVTMDSQWCDRPEVRLLATGDSRGAAWIPSPCPGQ